MINMLSYNLFWTNDNSDILFEFKSSKFHLLSFQFKFNMPKIDSNLQPAKWRYFFKSKFCPTLECRNLRWWMPVCLSVNTRAKNLLIASRSPGCRAQMDVQRSFRFRNVTDSIIFLLLKLLQTLSGRATLISTRSHKCLIHWVCWFRGERL